MLTNDHLSMRLYIMNPTTKDNRQRLRQQQSSQRSHRRKKLINGGICFTQATSEPGQRGQHIKGLQHRKPLNSVVRKYINHNPTVPYPSTRCQGLAMKF